MAFPKLLTDEWDAHSVTEGAPASRALQSKARLAEILKLVAGQGLIGSRFFVLGPPSHRALQALCHLQLAQGLAPELPAAAPSSFCRALAVQWEQ